MLFVCILLICWEVLSQRFHSDGLRMIKQLCNVWNVVGDCSYVITHTVVFVVVWSFERKTYTWWSPKSSHSWNPADFMWISQNLVDFTWNPPTKLINQIFQEKLFSFMECCGKAMSCFHMKSTGFHKICRISCEIRRISKDQQLPGMVRPMFILLASVQIYRNLFYSHWFRAGFYCGEMYYVQISWQNKMTEKQWHLIFIKILFLKFYCKIEEK